jgi:hypothetical protein
MDTQMQYLLLVYTDDELLEALPEASDDRVWEQKLAWAGGAWFVGFVGAVAVRELDREQLFATAKIIQQQRAVPVVAPEQTATTEKGAT